MPLSLEFLKNSGIEMGPFVKVQIHFKSCSQSIIPPPSLGYHTFLDSGVTEVLGAVSEVGELEPCTSTVSL